MEICNIPIIPILAPSAELASLLQSISAYMKYGGELPKSAMHLSPKISARRDASHLNFFNLSSREPGSMAGLEPSDPTYGFPFKPYKQQQK